MRPVLFRASGRDDHGLVSAGTLVGLGVVALISGVMFAGKSGWCSGLCPVHPVEQVYGQRPGITLRNAHCTTCVRCTARCPDSTPAMSPLAEPLTARHRALGVLMVGGFPGFVWGWFQVPDGDAGHAVHWAHAFAWPLGAKLVTAVASAGVPDRPAVMTTAPRVPLAPSSPISAGMVAGGVAIPRVVVDRMLAQLDLLRAEGGFGLRQLAHELDPARLLVGRDPLLHEGLQLLRVGMAAGVLMAIAIAMLAG